VSVYKVGRLTIKLKSRACDRLIWAIKRWCFIRCVLRTLYRRFINRATDGIRFISFFVTNHLSHYFSLENFMQMF